MLCPLQARCCIDRTRAAKRIETCCAVLQNNAHFIAACYRDSSNQLHVFDSCELYRVEERSVLLSAFRLWLHDGGNNVSEDGIVLHRTLQQPPGSQACGIFAVNNIVLFLSGAPGVLSREQLRERFNNPNYSFTFISDNRSRLCEKCGSTLRDRISKENKQYLVCEGKCMALRIERTDGTERRPVFVRFL